MPRFDRRSRSADQNLDVLLAALRERTASADEDLARLQFLSQRAQRQHPTLDSAFPEVDRSRLVAVLRHSWPVDDPLLVELEHADARLNARSEVEPPRQVTPDLELWLSLLEERLERPNVGTATLRLRSMAARAANHLGYLAFRDRHRRGAYRYYALSEGFARDANDEAELAVLLLRKQRLVAATDGIPAALSLVESVATRVTPGWPSGVTAWMWGEMARHESLLHREADARRHLELAFSAAERDPRRLNLFVPDKDSRWLARRPAYVALHLGHPEEAIQILEHNRADADPTLVRETIWNATELGEAWALHGDLDNACQCLTDALRRSIATEDRRGLLAIAGVRRRIGRWADDPRLQHLDEELRVQGVTV